jgi:glycerol-3-phosphate acyltransferase PlsX
VPSQDSYTVVAVDAMGGDHAPANVVAGAIDALREAGERFGIALVGRRDAIEAELKGQPCPAGCTIVHASEVITMDDAPNAALKSKRDSSIGVGLGMVRDGSAHAFVSAGNTGAVFSASTLVLGRLDGVGRPTIGTLIPTAVKPCLLLDAGANVDCRPDHLFEFGVMGSVFMTTMQGRPNPRVGLLNIGEEKSKGGEVAQEAYARLAASSLNFTGNVEGRDVLTGVVDVVVCDGFVGNVLLKFGESIPGFLKSRFTELAARSLRGKLVGLVARNSLRSVMKELDYQEYGGVPVLGVKGVSIIGHGGSTPRAIKNMIFRAEEMVARRLPANIQDAIKTQHA